MAVIVKLPRALTDLAEIWDYIADDSEVQADAFIDLVDRKLALLADQPNIGRVRQELGDKIRSFPLGRYAIFYVAIPHGIEVVRVLHGARDLDAIFQSDGN
jgi:toxin ParE1/3/4